MSFIHLFMINRVICIHYLYVTMQPFLINLSPAVVGEVGLLNMYEFEEFEVAHPIASQLGPLLRHSRHLGCAHFVVESRSFLVIHALLSSSSGCLPSISYCEVCQEYKTSCDETRSGRTIRASLIRVIRHYYSAGEAFSLDSSSSVDRIVWIQRVTHSK